MDEEFIKNLMVRRKKDDEKDKAYKQSSKERLFKICSTKIRTTMIGALDAIEKKLAAIWTPEDGKRPTNDQLALKKLYEEIRQEILDKGNNQIRNLESEFEQYEMEWKRYTLKLPIKTKE